MFCHGWGFSVLSAFSLPSQAYGGWGELSCPEAMGSGKGTPPKCTIVHAHLCLVCRLWYCFEIWRPGDLGPYSALGPFLVVLRHAPWTAAGPTQAVQCSDAAQLCQGLSLKLRACATDGWHALGRIWGRDTATPGHLVGLLLSDSPGCETRKYGDLFQSVSRRWVVEHGHSLPHWPALRSGILGLAK